MIKDRQVWYEPLEVMASTTFVRRFMAYAFVGMIGGILIMVVTLGTFNVQFYEWDLTTAQKSTIGFIALLIGAVVFMGFVKFMIHKGPIWPRLMKSGASEEQQHLAFAVYYYQRWTLVRSWMIRAGLILATLVAWTESAGTTNFREGFETTTPAFQALALYLIWAEFQLFRRLGSIPNVVDRSISRPLIAGTLATCFGFLILMPQLFGGLSFVDLADFGVTNTGIIMLSVIVFGLSEWASAAVRKLERLAKLHDVMSTANDHE